MKLCRRSFVIGLTTGLLVALLLWITGAGVAPNVLDRLDKQAINNWRVAREALLRDAAFRACVTENMVRQAATAKGLKVETHDKGTFRTPEYLAQAASVLRVHVVPGLPFDKDPGDLFGFDDQGCLLP